MALLVLVGKKLDRRSSLGQLLFGRRVGGFWRGGASSERPGPRYPAIALGGVPVFLLRIQKKANPRSLLLCLKA